MAELIWAAVDATEIDSRAAASAHLLNFMEPPDRNGVAGARRRIEMGVTQSQLLTWQG